MIRDPVCVAGRRRARGGRWRWLCAGLALSWAAACSSAPTAAPRASDASADSAVCGRDAALAARCDAPSPDASRSDPGSPPDAPGHDPGSAGADGGGRDTLSGGGGDAGPSSARRVLCRDAPLEVARADLSCRGATSPSSGGDELLLATVVQHIEDATAASQVLVQAIAPDGSVVASATSDAGTGAVRLLLPAGADGAWRGVLVAAPEGAPTARVVFPGGFRGDPPHLFLATQETLAAVPRAAGLAADADAAVLLLSAHDCAGFDIAGLRFEVHGAPAAARVLRYEGQTPGCVTGRSGAVYVAGLTAGRYEVAVFGRFADDDPVLELWRSSVDVVAGQFNQALFVVH